MRASLSFFPFGVDGKGFVKHSLQKLGVRYLLLDGSALQSLQSMLTELDVKIVPATNLQFLGLYLVKISPSVSVKLLQDVPGLAYCITTSGTTGTPKIVRVPHSCVLPNILDFKEEFKPGVGDTTFLTSPLTFDPCMIDIFMTLTSGAALLIVSPFVKMSPDSLLNVLSSRYKVTILQMTPSLFRQLDPRRVRERLMGKDSALRILAFGGETFPDDKCLHACLHPDNTTSIYNVYGITEVSCWATLHCARCPKGSVKDSVPIGRPLTGTRVKVLGEHGEELKSGVGHIWIGGSQRTCLLNEEGEEGLRGGNVWRQTGDLGVIHPDGSIYCMGRLDRQIKRNGKRLDLNTLEKVCCQLSGVEECRVVHSQDKLHIFVKPSGSQNEENVVGKVKGLVKDTLPAQYQPDGVTLVSVFPVNSHGKLDVASLLQMTKVKGETHKPTSINDAQSWCSNLWQGILEDGKTTPSPSDQFLVLGGDSLTAVRLVERVEECLGRDIPDLLDLVLTKTFDDFVCEIRRQWTLADMATSTSQATGIHEKRQLHSRKLDFDETVPPVKRNKQDFVHDIDDSDLCPQIKKDESDKNLDVIESPMKRKNQDLDVTDPPVKKKKQTSEKLCKNLEVSCEHPSSDSSLNGVICSPAKQTHTTHKFDLNAQTMNDALIDGELNKEKRKPCHQKPHQTGLNSSCKEAKSTCQDVCVNSIDRLPSDCTRLRSDLSVDSDGDVKTERQVCSASQTPLSHQDLFVNSIGRANKSLQANVNSIGRANKSLHANTCTKMCSSVLVGVSVAEDTKPCSRLSVAKANDSKMDSNLSVTNVGDTKMCSNLSEQDGIDTKTCTNFSVGDSSDTKMCTNLSLAKTVHTRTCSNKSEAKTNDTEMHHSLSVANTGKTKVCCNLSTDHTNDLKSERRSCSLWEKTRLGGDTMELQLQWSFDTGKCVDASPLIATTRSGRTVVFIGSHSHHFFAVNLNCGTQLWSVELGDRVESSACLSPCGQYVIVGCYDHCIYVLGATTGEVEWQVRTGEMVKCSPVSDVVSSLVFCASHDGSLYALQCEKRKVLWTSWLGGGGVFASPVVNHDGRCVFAATLAGHVTAVAVVTGARLWSVSVGKPVFSSPALPADHLYVGCVDSSLYCLSSLTGSQVWVHKPVAPIFSSPAIVTRESTQRSSILVGCHDNCLYSISDTGELEWKYSTPSTVYASPFVFCQRNIQRNRCSRYASLECSQNVHQKHSKYDVELCLAEHQTERCKVQQFHKECSERTFVKEEQESERKVCRQSTTHSTNKFHNGHQTCSESQTLSTNTTGSENGVCERCEMLSTNRMEIPSEMCTGMNTHCTNTLEHTSEICESPENFTTNNAGSDYKPCEQLVACASTKGTVSIVSCETGKPQGQTVLPGEVFSSPVIVSDRLVVGCRDDRVYCYKLTFLR